MRTHGHEYCSLNNSMQTEVCNVFLKCPKIKALRFVIKSFQIGVIKNARSSVGGPWCNCLQSQNNKKGFSLLCPTASDAGGYNLSEGGKWRVYCGLLHDVTWLDRESKNRNAARVSCACAPQLTAANWFSHLFGGNRTTGQPSWLSSHGSQ